MRRRARDNDLLLIKKLRKRMHSVMLIAEISNV